MLPECCHVLKPLCLRFLRLRASLEQLVFLLSARHSAHPGDRLDFLEFFVMPYHLFTVTRSAQKELVLRHKDALCHWITSKVNPTTCI